MIHYPSTVVNRAVCGAVVDLTNVACGSDFDCEACEKAKSGGIDIPRQMHVIFETQLAHARAIYEMGQLLNRRRKFFRR